MPYDHLVWITDNASTISPNPKTLELLLRSAIVEKVDASIWASQMDANACVELLAGFIETATPIQLPTIALALGETKSPKAIRYLAPLLSHTRQDVQRAAIDGLVMIEHSSVIPPLYQAVRNERKLNRATPIIQAFETIRTEEAIHMLVLLAAEHTNPHVRGRAHAVLATLNHPQSLGLILSQLSNRDATIQRDSISLLSQIFQKDPTQFVSSMKHSEKGAHLWTIDILQQLNIDDKQIFDLLVLVLNDGVFQARSAAATMIGQLNIENSTKVTPLISALQDKNAAVRQKAAIAIGHLKIEDERLVTPLISALQDKNATVRQHAATAIGNLNITDERWVAPLISALQDGNAHVRQNAASALANWTVRDEQMVAPLISALQDGNATVRKKA
ncbi:MAG: HEAT repeat domain-containing protein, partial [Chloroflexota bacterium]